VQAEALVDIFSDTSSVVVSNTSADSLRCVEVKAPVKTKAYTVVDTLNEVEAKALVYTQSHTISQVQAKSVTDTLTGYSR